jgi:hypothetical protein
MSIEGYALFFFLSTTLGYISLATYKKPDILRVYSYDEIMTLISKQVRD